MAIFQAYNDGCIKLKFIMHSVCFHGKFISISIFFLCPALERAEAIVRQADIVAAFTLDVLKGTTRAFDSCEYPVQRNTVQTMDSVLVYRLWFTKYHARNFISRRHSYNYRWRAVKLRLVCSLPQNFEQGGLYIVTRDLGVAMGQRGLSLLTSIYFYHTVFSPTINECLCYLLIRYSWCSAPQRTKDGGQTPPLSAPLGHPSLWNCR